MHRTHVRLTLMHRRSVWFVYFVFYCFFSLSLSLSLLSNTSFIGCSQFSYARHKPSASFLLRSMIGTQVHALTTDASVGVDGAQAAAAVAKLTRQAVNGLFEQLHTLMDKCLAQLRHSASLFVCFFV